MPSRRDADGKTRRGVSNGNERGNNEARRRRRAWLLETYASDVKLIKVTYEDGVSIVVRPLLIEDLRWWQAQVGSLPLGFTTLAVTSAEEIPTARCYRCGDLLHDGTLTVDRIIPGCNGGTYARTNIRPACGMDNSSTGAPLASVKTGKVTTPRRR